MVWLPTPTYRGNGLRRVVNIMTFAARLLWMSRDLALRARPDLVITSSTHPLDIYGGRRIARLAGAALIHEVHDLWPLTLVELGGMPRWHPFVMVLQAAENHAYRRADRVVSMLPASLPYMQQHGLSVDRFEYVPNGVAVMQWERPEPLPALHARTLDGLTANSKFIVGYAGGFALSNDLDSLLTSLNHVRRSDVHLVLVGTGEQRDDLERRYASERISFLPPIPKAAIPSLLARFDACFLGMRRSPLYRFGVNPNKLFDYMMAARPIISAVAASNDPVSESGAGLTVRPQDPEAIADAIDRLASESPDERRRRGERGRWYVREHHDYRVLAARFIEGLNKSGRVVGQSR
jgi:glycosyltransferase involved in cell wall biosynthesis